MSYERHGAGRCRRSMECTISFEDMVHGRKRPSSLLAAKTEKRRQVQSLKDIATVVSERR